MYYIGTPDGGTEIQIPVPIVTLDLPLPNFRSVANAATKVSSGIDTISSQALLLFVA